MADGTGVGFVDCRALRCSASAVQEVDRRRGNAGRACSHDEGDGAGLATATTGNTQMLVSSSLALGACGCGVCALQDVCCNNSANARYLAPTLWLPLSTRRPAAGSDAWRWARMLGERELAAWGKQASRQRERKFARVCLAWCFFSSGSQQMTDRQRLIGAWERIWRIANQILLRNFILFL